MDFQELNSDQRRESVNSRQRFAAWSKSREELTRFKGSMVWSGSGAGEYLVRSAYDPKTGIRRQKSLGSRSPETEKAKAEFDLGRGAAKERYNAASQHLDRQASINRAVGLNRVPLLGAKIAVALDEAGLLGAGIKIVGTNAIYAYEAAAGVHLEAGLTTTEDIDLLFEARQTIRFASDIELSERSLMSILRKVDRSFERGNQTFRAVNREGYLVDFIKPLPRPPWKDEPEVLADDDLVAAGMDGLSWLQNSPTFEAIVMDEKGWPLRMVTPDPRVFAVHKFWLSQRDDRDPVKRKRDSAQAKAVAQLVSLYLTHLPYDPDQLRMVPIELLSNARFLFDTGKE